MCTHKSHHQNECSADQVSLGALRTGVAELHSYFSAGSKTASQRKMGFELEQIIVDASNNTLPFAGPDCTERSGAGCVTALLGRLSTFYDSEVRADKQDPTSPLIGLSRKDAAISLEPGAQFEFSSMPFWKLEDLRFAWKQFQDELISVTSELGYQPLTIGYQPRTKVADITILPKERYGMMNQHFKSTGKHGMNMMRGTASTQVTIDYTDEADAVTKMRVAAALTPLFSLLTDNTPFFEGKPVKGHLKRTVIWNDVDSARSMIPPGLFSADYGLDDYARTALTSPVILFDRGDTVSYAGNKGAVDCYDMDNLAKEDIEHILSMLFFDVRLRNYVEIRCADSIPFPYALGYVALIKGLFYDKENLAKLREQFRHLTDDCVPAIKAALISDGYEANVTAFYGEDVQSALARLLMFAQQGLERLATDTGIGAEEVAYLDVFDPLVEGKVTLAELAQQSP